MHASHSSGRRCAKGDALRALRSVLTMVAVCFDHVRAVTVRVAAFVGTNIVAAAVSASQMILASWKPGDFGPRRAPLLPVTRGLCHQSLAELRVRLPGWHRAANRAGFTLEFIMPAVAQPAVRTAVQNVIQDALYPVNTSQGEQKETRVHQKPGKCWEVLVAHVAVIMPIAFSKDLITILRICALWTFPSRTSSGLPMSFGQKQSRWWCSGCGCGTWVGVGL